MILAKVAEDSNAITLGWSAVAGARSYRLTAEKQSKATFAGPNATQAKFAKGSAWYKVEALDVLDEGVYPSSPSSVPYWEWDGTGGKYQPLATIFAAYHSDPQPYRLKDWGGLEASLYDTPYLGGSLMSTDPALRVHLVPSARRSGWVSRQEIRASDPPWYSGQDYDKASIRNLSPAALNGPFTQGMVRWFAWDYFVPLDYGADHDTFNFSTGWHTLMDLHGVGNSYEQLWNVLEAGVYNFSGARWIAYHLGAHEGSSDPAPADTELIRLAQLTDASGNRIASSHNTWHELVVGVKFASDGTIGSSSGWVEIWHDGVNILPRHARPTCFPNESSVWMQAQNYKQHSAPFVAGTSSVIYYGGMRAGLTRQDVQQKPPIP